MCRPKHVEQLRNIGIINSTTRLHLVGSIYEIYRLRIFEKRVFRRICLIYEDEETENSRNWPMKRSPFLIATVELDDDLCKHLVMYVRKFFQVVGSLVTQI